MLCFLGVCIHRTPIFRTILSLFILLSLQSYNYLFIHTPLSLSLSLFILLSLYSFYYSFCIYTNLYSRYSLRIFPRSFCIHLTLSLFLLLSLQSYYYLFIYTTLSLSLFILLFVFILLLLYLY